MHPVGTRQTEAPPFGDHIMFRHLIIGETRSGEEERFVSFSDGQPVADVENEDNKSSRVVDQVMPEGSASAAAMLFSKYERRYLPKTS
ncbi:hypothetical protein M514_00626, partial [Trichuris suis]